MPANGEDTHYAVCYPHEEQYQVWKNEAEDMGISVSKWIQYMAEAGRKKFEVDVDHDEDKEELRRQRNDLHTEVRETRRRLNQLQTQLYQGEREAMFEFIQDNPGATRRDLVVHLIDEAPSRVNRQLEALEGERIEKREDGYYVK